MAASTMPSLGAEGGNEGIVLAAKYEYVRVRLVEVIGRGKLQLFHPFIPFEVLLKKFQASDPTAGLAFYKVAA
jgi:hypothetical protein